MSLRQMSADGCNDKSTYISGSVLGGFHYFQSTVCGYDTCSYSLPHYHCQNCGYGTTELPNAAIHRDSCSRFLRGRLSLPPCSQPALLGTQAAERPFSSPSYDPGPDSTMPAMSISSMQSSMQISSTGNHLYYRGGSQQSSVFSSLLSGQSQPLYSGVFGSQVGFSSQSNYPSTFNGYSHVEPPSWLSDTRLNPSANSIPTLDSVRTSKTLSCSSEGVSHSCCGSRIGLLENIALCSPLSSETYKPSGKEPASCQQKNTVSMENPNRYCGQNVCGYNNQSVQNSVYKCTEPFSSCTMSQLGIPLNERGDVKHAGLSYDSNFVAKQSNTARKSCSLEVNKNLSLKYNSSHASGQFLENSSPCLQQKMQGNGSYDSHHVLSDGDLQDDVYSQGSVFLSDEHIASLPYISKTSFFQTNVSDSGKSFGSPPCQMSTLSRCGLIACEVLEGCLQLEGQPLYQCSNQTSVSASADDDKVSNPGSCSGAAESDIVVEESEEDDVMENEVSTEDGRKTSQTSCLVCSSSNAYFIHVNIISPVTSTSRIPVATKLAQVMASDSPLPVLFHNEIICKRCLSLVEAVDSLEYKLASAKQNLIELYRNRAKLIKLSVDENPCERSMPVNFESSVRSSSENGIKMKDSVPVEEGELKSEVNQDDSANKNSTSGRDEVERSSLESSLCLDGAAVVKQNSNGEYICSVCRKCKASKHYLEKHMQKHSKVLSFFCDYCSQGFVLRADLEDHLGVHMAENRFQCEICGKCFVQQGVLEDHLQKHCRAFRLSCSHCKKGFMYASTLRVHERIHTGERPYVCQHCGRKFICASNLTAHIRICSGQLLFSCEYCNKKFSTPSRLKKHSITMHDSSSSLKCKICGKCFLKACDLKVHSRSHSGEKPHACKVCGKCYSSVGNLNQHSRKHCADRPFVCSICGKGFLRKSILERHMNQHTGNRPYKCNVCNKGFVSAQNLHTHSKLHTGKLKKYTCPICGKVMNNGLKVHMRTHSGDKPYKCSVCLLSFSVKSTLDKHMRLKHNNTIKH